MDVDPSQLTDSSQSFDSHSAGSRSLNSQTSGSRGGHSSQSVSLESGDAPHQGYQPQRPAQVSGESCDGHSMGGHDSAEACDEQMGSSDEVEVCAGKVNRRQMCSFNLCIARNSHRLHARLSPPCFLGRYPVLWQGGSSWRLPLRPRSSKSSESGGSR